MRLTLKVALPGDLEDLRVCQARSLRPPQCVYEGRHTTLQTMATTPSFTSPFTPTTPPQLMVEDDHEFESEKIGLKWSAEQAVGRHEKRAGRAPDGIRGAAVYQASQSRLELDILRHKTLFRTRSRCDAASRIPHDSRQHLLISGLFACLVNGAMMPIFLFLLSPMIEADLNAKALHCALNTVPCTHASRPPRRITAATGPRSHLSQHST